jgi:DNA polymerase kappa
MLNQTNVTLFDICNLQAFTRARALPRYVNAKDDILPIARELLLREFPLTLRLLGIRITSLKDLRPPANGIEKV